MYWSGGGRGKKPNGWKPPTKNVYITFREFLAKAVEAENRTVESPHYYFRVSDPDAHWLWDELPFFQPKPSLFIKDPHGQRGIHCRFGMRGVIAEAHFDGSRNMIALFGGFRRYILSHPRECANMHLLPNGHPSGRHSDVDWSKPDHARFPNFNKTRANEVILTSGDMLFLPQMWFHYIISLGLNWQCNTRSGRSKAYQQEIRDCGF